MLKVNINQLTFDCIIGILDFERTTAQTVVVDLSFEYFFKEDGSNFVDYAKVASYIEATMKEQQFRLIEDAIIYLRQNLKEQFQIVNLKLKIAKPTILPNAIVSVEE